MSDATGSDVTNYDLGFIPSPGFVEVAPGVFDRFSDTVPAVTQRLIEFGAWFRVTECEWEERDGKFYRTIRRVDLLEEIANAR